MVSLQHCSTTIGLLHPPFAAQIVCHRALLDHNTGTANEESTQSHHAGAAAREPNITDTTQLANEDTLLPTADSVSCSASSPPAGHAEQGLARGLGVDTPICG